MADLWRTLIEKHDFASESAARIKVTEMERGVGSLGALFHGDRTEVSHQLDFFQAVSLKVEGHLGTEA